MLIPIRTDAPVYYYPWATLGIMLVNCIVFLITGQGAGPATKYFVLEFGTGLHPLQWLTVHFVHFGWMHIIGNTIFLWGFGLVVEGKIGWWRFLLLYLGIGLVIGICSQAMMLGVELDPFSPQYAGGASGVVFALVGIALVWAPKNDVSCILFLWIRIFYFDLSILWFSAFYIIKEMMWTVLWTALFGFQMSGSLVHFSGGLIGIAVGLALLKLDWVDCENWDLLAVLRGTYGSREKAEELELRRSARYLAASPRPLEEIVEGAPPPERALPRPTGSRNKNEAVRIIRKLLLESKATAALKEYLTVQHFHPEWNLGESDLRALINALFRVRVWKEVIPLLDDYIERFAMRADRMRLKRAGLAVQVEQRPRFALRLIENVDVEALNKNERRQWERIIKAAQELIKKGDLELGDVG